MNRQVYPEGLDVVWIASDHSGNVGAFVTGGVGPIPLTALDKNPILLEEVEEAISGLPRTSDTVTLVQLKRPDDFVNMAQRGFFVYDWRDVHRKKKDLTHKYELISMPTIPISVDSLPILLKQAALSNELTHLTFNSRESIDIVSQLKCVSGE